MTKTILIALSIIGCISCNRQLIVNDGISIKGTNSILTYNLPKKKFQIKVEFEEIQSKSSIFAQKDFLRVYQEELSNLDNKLAKIVKDDTIFKLVKIDIIEEVIPDENKVYSIEIVNPKWFEIFTKLDYSISLNDNGILTDSKYKYDNYVADFSADILTGIISYVLKPTTEAASGSSPSTFDHDAALIELQKAIERINRLEARKVELLCVNLENIESETIVNQIKLIDAELKTLYGLVLGKKLPTKKKTKIFNYNPSTKLEIFFDKSTGPQLTKIGDPYTISTKIIPRWNATSKANYTKRLGIVQQGLAYNIPELCEIEIIKGTDLLARKQTLIPQLGTIGYISTKGLNHINSTVKLDPNSGALLSSSTKNSFFEDPNKYGSSIAEAIKDIEKKDDPSPISEIDKQIGELSKKFQLLDLQHKIDSLESIIIDP